jgi:hypothetical protein
LEVHLWRAVYDRRGSKGLDNAVTCWQSIRVIDATVVTAS